MRKKKKKLLNSDTIHVTYYVSNKLINKNIIKIYFVWPYNRHICETVLSERSTKYLLLKNQFLFSYVPFRTDKESHAKL